MRVNEIVFRGIVSIGRNACLRTAAIQLAANEVGALLVEDAGHPVGVFGERDLAQAVADDADLDNTRVREYMTASPVTIQEGQFIEEAIRSMNLLGVRHLAVVAEDEVVGMVSARDILRAIDTMGRGKKSA